MVAAERRGSHTRNCPDFGWCRPAVRGRLTNYPAPQAVLRHPALLFGLPRPRLEGNMAQDLIADQDTGKNVAIMRGGEVFRDDREGARIAIVLNDYLYDLNGVLVGHLNGRHVIDVNTRSMPIGFKKLLEGKS
jgi:hypothetical protein